MFERYTEKARRVIFFSRYEASQFGSPYIETEHILLGLLREDKALTFRFLRTPTPMESIRKQIEEHSTIREKVSTSVDLPLSNESKRVLAFAAEEAERLGHRHIGTEHLFLGMLREEKCFAAVILQECGLRLAAVREELARVSHEVAQRPPYADDTSPLARFARDLTQAAAEDRLDPVIGRDAVTDAIIEVLHNRTSSNPLLVGEPGVGKTAIVEGLAQRVAINLVPPLLAGKKIFVVDLAGLAAGTRDRSGYENRLTLLIKEAAAQNAILYIEELAALAGVNSADGSLEATNVLRSTLSRREIQCITEATPADYDAILHKHPWFAKDTRMVAVSRFNESETLAAISGLKERFEKYHAVFYSAGALEAAAHHCAGRLDKAVDVLDIAGTRVKLRQSSLPPEMIEAQKRIRFIAHRMENAIATHEFEKAKFYANEERKETEGLRALHEKYKIDETVQAEVTKQDVERAISHPTG